MELTVEEIVERLKFLYGVDIEKDKFSFYFFINFVKDCYEIDMAKYKSMLNIVVINCDGKYVEYEWDSKKAFVQDMQSDNENIPMLDDPLTEVNTQDDNLQLWWRNTDGMTIGDLLEECKQESN